MPETIYLPRTQSTMERMMPYIMQMMQMYSRQKFAKDMATKKEVNTALDEGWTPDPNAPPTPPPQRAPGGMPEMTGGVPPGQMIGMPDIPGGGGMPPPQITSGQQDFTPPIFGEQGLLAPQITPGRLPSMAGMTPIPNARPGVPPPTPIPNARAGQGLEQAKPLKPTTKFPTRIIGGKVYVNEPPRANIPEDKMWVWNKKEWDLVDKKKTGKPTTIKGENFHWIYDQETKGFRRTEVPVGGQKGPYKVGTIQDFKEGEKLIQKIYTEKGWQPTGKTAPRFESKSPKVPPKVRQAQALVLKFSKTVDPTVAALISMNPTMANSPIVKQAMQAGIPDDLKPAYQQAIKIIDEYYGVPQEPEKGLFSGGEITHEFVPGQGLVPVGR